METEEMVGYKTVTTYSANLENGAWVLVVTLEQSKKSENGPWKSAQVSIGSTDKDLNVAIEAAFSALLSCMEELKGDLFSLDNYKPNANVEVN